MKASVFFRRYQKLLLKVLNFSVRGWFPFRKLFPTSGIKDLTARLLQITPTSFTWHNGTEFVSGFHSGPVFARVVQKWLQRLQWAAYIPALFKPQLAPLFALTIDTFEPGNGSTEPFDIAMSKGGSSVWATVRESGDASGNSAVDTLPYIEADYSGGNYTIHRFIICFATGATISAGAAINSATVALKSDETPRNTDTTSITITKYTGSTSSAPAASGWSTIFLGLTGNMTEGSDRIAYAGKSAGDVYTFTLDATGRSWIATGSGTTPLAAVCTLDATDTAPSGTNGAYFASADHASLAAPLLTVNWTAVTTTHNSLLLLNVG